MPTKTIKRFKLKTPLKRKRLSSISSKELVEKGLPLKYFNQLTKGLNLTINELCDILSINPRTLARRKKIGKFTLEESDRIMRVYLLFQKAKKLFKDDEEVASWFKTPKQALGKQTPLEFVKTEVGGREVEDLLGQIEFTVYS